MGLLALSLLAAALAACDTGGSICPAFSAPAVVVRVVDATTGEPAAEGALGMARDAAFADTLGRHDVNEAQEITSLSGAFGRPGEYRVNVERAGHARWERSGVVVRSSGGKCPQPVTAVLDARLQPAAP